MTDITEKIKTIREATERLKVRFADYERGIADEKAIAFLKRCKRRGLIQSYVGDPDNKEG